VTRDAAKTWLYSFLTLIVLVCVWRLYVNDRIGLAIVAAAVGGTVNGYAINAYLDRKDRR